MPVAVAVAGCNSADVAEAQENRLQDRRVSCRRSEIPPDLTSPGSDDRYVVPDINPTGSATFSAYDKERNKAP